MFIVGKLMIILIMYITVSAVEGLKSTNRRGRLILGPRPTSVVTHDRYSYCRFGNTTGACLDNFACNTEGGSFLGYCNGQDGVCCNVVKSCGETSSSHEVSFQNPLFPERETEPKICVLTLNIGRGICAMRLHQDFFELRKYDGDYCPSDHLTILGSKNITTPICGNMTGWATTFEVNELSQVRMAMIVQGSPSYKFSTRLSMLACDQISPLNSPTNAGIRNADAIKYTTTEAPAKTTTEASILEESTTEGGTTVEDDATTTEMVPEDSEVVEEEDETTTMFIPPRRSDEGGDITVATTEKTSPSTLSTLPTATFKTVGSTAPSIVFSENTMDEDDQSELITGAYDPTSQNSIFNQIFSSRSGQEQCLRYEDSEEVFNPNPFQFKKKDKCYLYDTVDGTYKVSDNCDPEKEEEEESSFRVIGGHYANLNEYPWQVALIYRRRFFCGGALISDRHILTASHCVFGSFSLGLNNLVVSLGDHDLKTKNETKNTAARVKSVIWNLHFSPKTTANDIAIFELTKPVEYSYNISPVKLPSDIDNFYKDQVVIVTGWGRNSLKSKKTSTLLKEYKSTVHDVGNCVKKWKTYPSINAVRDMHICLNLTHGTPCHGDSGGPLVACIEDQCTIVGVVSFGFPLCKNVGLPAVFSRVTYFKRWIDINTSPIYYQNVGPEDKK